MTTATFDQEVLKSTKLVMVDFWASWCGPCNALAPHVERAARERADIKVVRVDVDANPRLATKYEIDGIPTLMFFRNGQYVGETVGAMSYERLTRVIDRALNESGRERPRGAKAEIVGEFSKYPKQE